jgi:hypothetical protein
MSCKFSIPISGSPEAMLAKAKSTVQNQGGQFNGDANSGTFSVKVMGTIEGSYTVSGNELLINIDNKPMFIPCGTIEGFLKSQLG